MVFICYIFMIFFYFWQYLQTFHFLKVYFNYLTLELAKKSTSPALPRQMNIRVAGGGICNLCDDDPVERQMKRLLVKVHPLIHQSFILRCLPLFIVQDISRRIWMWVIVGWCSDAELRQKLWLAKVTSKKLVKNDKVDRSRIRLSITGYKVKYSELFDWNFTKQIALAHTHQHQSLQESPLNGAVPIIRGSAYNCLFRATITTVFNWCIRFRFPINYYL